MTNLLDRDLTAAPDEPTPIDVWLQRQQDLSAVERFSVRHDEFAEYGVALPQARWRERMPATPPGPGQQYAFEVDLDSCTGCKACVAACHSLNGLDDGEDWRRVGSLHDAGTSGAGGSVTVTSACHHCVDPACMKGCPAKAYEKDPATGIVRHLDDACIGCSYCTLTCPYEVPVFNQALGIVRKCDLCSDRLSAGEAPACVQGCPQGAITIALASVEDLLSGVVTRTDGAAPALVPTAPRSSLTVPSTTYVSERPVPASWVAGDQSSMHPSHGHTPLAVMLALTQAAVGMTVAASWLRATADLPRGATGALGLIGLLTGLAAIAASTLHLGRPLLAWRAILGLRRSWLSREIAAFGLFAGAGVAHAVLRMIDVPEPFAGVAGAASVGGGLAGVACSVQLYAVTGRRWWRRTTTGARFTGSMTATGAAGTAAVLSLVDPTAATPFMTVLQGVAALGVVASVLSPLLPLWLAGRSERPSPELMGTRRLLGHQLQNRHRLRVLLAGLGLVLLLPAGSAPLFAVAAWMAIAVGEYQDRRLFFLASIAPRMPGSPR